MGANHKQGPQAKKNNKKTTQLPLFSLQQLQKVSLIDCHSGPRKEILRKKAPIPICQNQEKPFERKLGNSLS